MTQRYNFGDAFSYFDVPQEFGQTASFRSQNNPAVYTPGGVMNPELLQKLARGQVPAEEGRGIMDLLKSGAAGARDIFLQGVGASGGLNIGARLGMLVNPALAIPGALAGAFLGSKVTEMGPSGVVYENLSDEQKSRVDEIYGQGGIMQGYNPVSMFGQGVVGAIDNRRANIMETLRRQALQGKKSEVLQKRLDDLAAERRALNNPTTGSGQSIQSSDLVSITDDRGQDTGFSEYSDPGTAASYEGSF